MGADVHVVVQEHVMEQKSVIIIIPCSDLNEYVLECLRGCLGLDYSKYSIALLPDAPLELPEEFRNRNIIVMPTGDVTISAKRNLAIRSFRDADYYAFIDSDAYPDVDWLKNGTAAFAGDDIMAVGGPGLSPPNECLHQKVVGNAVKSFLVSGNLAFSKIVSANRYCLNLHSCDLIVSRLALERIGGFNEGLKTGEDRELCRRIRKNGGKIYFSNNVIVYHHNRYFGRHFFMQRIIHGYSIFSITQADRDWHDAVLFVPLFCSALAGAGLLAGFADKAYWIFSGSCIALYFLVALAEAARKSDSAGELPLTFLSIITSNAGYVLGSIMGLLGMKLNFRKMYRNYLNPGRGRQDNCNRDRAVPE